MWNPEMELAMYNSGRRSEKERARLKQLVRDTYDVLVRNPAPALQALADKLANEMRLWNER